MTPLPQDSEQDRIDVEAGGWLVLLSDRELTRAEAADLAAWRAADPRHEATFAEIERTWDELPEMAHLGALAPIDALPEAPRSPSWETADREPPRRRRWIAVAALGAVAAAFIAFLLVPGMIGTGTRYETQIAETRLLTLPDGSQVTLGPRSTLSVKFDQGERRVVLAGGEAFFDVTYDAARPFVVEAGTSLVRVVGTKFDVNRSSDTVRVSVLEGVVRVYDSRPKDGAGTVRILRAGQRTEVALIAPAATSESLVAAAAAPPPVSTAAQPPGAWREGRLVYENVRLADLVADVNRYYAPGVTLGDPQVGNVRITAAFKASEIPGFMEGLSGTVRASAEERSGGGYTIRSQQN